MNRPLVFRVYSLTPSYGRRCTYTYVNPHQNSHLFAGFLTAPRDLTAHVARYPPAPFWRRPFRLRLGQALLTRSLSPSRRLRRSRPAHFGLLVKKAEVKS